MRRAILIASIALASLAGGAALWAQSADDIDVQAIKARAAAMADDAEAFVAHVKDRGDALREEATKTADGGRNNLKRLSPAALPTGPKGVVDFDELVAGAVGNLDAPRGQAPQFIAFASLSMPEESLKRMIADVSRAGGVVVFRGFPDNSMKAFQSAIARLVEDKADYASIGIDPRLFRAFEIQAVPTYIVVGSDFDLCEGFRCKTVVPPNDRLTGNVTVEYALASFADGSGPGAKVAAVALGNLRKTQP
ncbi:MULTISPECIES: type-F conjugative transfer system pilin assembly protein TrbC [Sphingomonadaceae]|uniref:Type-F conjugative transfer system pilin assembly protein TrbC n=1 Tax=Rhizorhabdus wittichii TaxID=160791 RepID=A0A975HGR9_9SPHN|nr:MULTISPECIES: type-F conjugative transfer system pilin assembly protein TrbC [Sphingomonadaceae]QTH24765.1 type-F conjugative transfer system pilin assembly protein TrbC [Rhizorhabdus wittichii]QUM74487.1 type-F conjugative transfer system pilin assembly protein TrbC [Sphingopyxis granuli]